MSLTVADVAMIAPTTEVCRWIERNLPVRHALPWVSPGALPAPALAPKARITPPTLAMPTELRVSELYWPVYGAQRFAYGCFLADTAAVDQIRLSVFPDGDDDSGSDASGGTTTDDDSGGDSGGSGPQQVTLHLDDGRDGGESVDVLMNLHRFVPLSSVPDDPDAGFVANNLYLVILVCDRYYWQATPAPDPKILPYGSYNPSSSNYAGSSSSGGSTGSGGDGQDGDALAPPTWEDLIKALADALGVTVALPDIDPAYLSPDPAFNLAGMPCAAVLDAALASVGLRMYATLDGNYAAQGWKDAMAARAADDASDAGQARALRAGGDQFADASDDSTTTPAS